MSPTFPNTARAPATRATCYEVYSRLHTRPDAILMVLSHVVNSVHQTDTKETALTRPALYARNDEYDRRY